MVISRYVGSGGRGMWGDIGERRYLAFSGDGDDSAKGREEKSGKVVVLLKSGRGGMVIKLSQCGENFLSSENLLWI